MFLFWTYFFLLFTQWWSIPLKQKLCLHPSVFGESASVYSKYVMVAIIWLIFPEFQNLVELIHWVSSNLRQFWQVMYFSDRACINQEIFDESAKATKMHVYWSWVMNLRSISVPLPIPCFAFTCLLLWMLDRTSWNQLNYLEGVDFLCIRSKRYFAYHAKCTTSV